MLVPITPYLIIPYPYLLSLILILIPLGKAGRSLYLSDIYAVIQGTHGHSAHTPLTTPRSPAASIATTTASSLPGSTPSLASGTHPHHQATTTTSPKKLKRRQSSSSSISFSLSGSDCYFTVYALKSHPGTVGHLVKVSFRCPTPETAQTWAEQITHQMLSEFNGCG